MLMLVYPYKQTIYVSTLGSKIWVLIALVIIMFLQNQTLSTCKLGYLNNFALLTAHCFYHFLELSKGNYTLYEYKFNPRSKKGKIM